MQQRKAGLNEHADMIITLGFKGLTLVVTLSICYSSTAFRGRGNIQVLKELVFKPVSSSIRFPNDFILRLYAGKTVQHETGGNPDTWGHANFLPADFIR